MQLRDKIICRENFYTTFDCLLKKGRIFIIIDMNLDDHKYEPPPKSLCTINLRLGDSTSSYSITPYELQTYFISPPDILRTKARKILQNL